MRMYSSGMLYVDGRGHFSATQSLSFFFFDLINTLELISKGNISLGFENKTNY